MTAAPQTPPSRQEALAEIERQALLRDGITAPPVQVSGLTLRKPGIGSIPLLARTQNRVFTADGAMVELTDGNIIHHLDDIFAFVFIHCAPLDEVVRLCHGPLDAFRQAVSLFALKIDDADLPDLVTKLQFEQKLMDAARVNPEPKSGDDDEPDPNADGQGGKPA